MRVVNMGYDTIITAISCILLGVLFIWFLIKDNDSALLVSLGYGLISYWLMFFGILFSVRGKWSRLYLTGGILKFYFVKPLELPKLYQIMEAVENWTSNKER